MWQAKDVQLMEEAEFYIEPPTGNLFFDNGYEVLDSTELVQSFGTPEAKADSWPTRPRHIADALLAANKSPAGPFTMFRDW